MEGDDEEKAVYQDAEQSEYLDQWKSVSAYVLGGMINQRVSQLKDSNEWVEPDERFEEVVRSALETRCPDLVAGKSEDCSDIGGYLDEVLPTYRSFIRVNRAGLEW